MKVGVVGLGLIGGSLLRALGGVGYDADPDVRSAAAADGFAVVSRLDELAGCELILVAVPPGVTYDVAEQVLAAVPDAMVADTASVKGDVPELERFVAAHPMAGAEVSGWASSSAELLQGATWAVCPSDPSLEPLLRLGGVVDGPLVACTGAEHDAAVARVSHVPHLVAQALAALGGDGLAASLAGTAFRDMTRVAWADAALWTGILDANRDACVAALGELRERLGEEPAWRPPAPRSAAQWDERRIDGGWEELLELGRAGRGVRRLRDEGGVLWAEVAR